MISWEQTQSLCDYKGDGVKRLKMFLIEELSLCLDMVCWLSFIFPNNKNDIM